MPVKETKWLKRRLKRLRTAAGEARDLDVMISNHTCSKTQGRKSLLGHLRKQRKKAQQPLVRISKLMECKWRRRLKRNTAACTAAVQCVPPGQVAELVEHRVMDAARFMLVPLPRSDVSIDVLHRLRIKAKCVRYGIELFGAMSGKKLLRELHSMACTLQSKLGVLNDHMVASKRLRRVDTRNRSKRFCAQLDHLREQEASRASQARRDFFDWWTSIQVSSKRYSVDTSPPLIQPAKALDL